MANVAALCNRVVASESMTRRQLEAVVGLLNFGGPMLPGKMLVLQTRVPGWNLLPTEWMLDPDLF